MKFLNSEGRLVCLLEQGDGEMLLQHNIPNIEVLLVPITIKEHIEESHVWKPILAKVKGGHRGVIYF
jgi:hypothetical protein